MELNRQGGRFREIDILKGILILLVVIGHIIPQFDELIASCAWRNVLRIIYGFHMQAFVFVAGFCSAGLLRVDDADACRGIVMRRARRLLLPYVTWGALYFAARAIVPTLAAEPFDWSRTWQFVIGYNPDGALWFLWALFAATALTVCLLKFFSLGRMTLVAAVIMVVALATQPWMSLPVAVNALPLFLFFFLAGLLARSRIETLLFRMAHPLFGLLALFAWCGSMVLFPMAPPNQPWFLLGITSVAGTALAFFVSVRLARFDERWSAPFVFLSGYAMEIYIIAEPVKVVCRSVFSRLGFPIAISFPVMLILMLSVPVMLSRRVLRDRRARLLLLGSDNSEMP